MTAAQPSLESIACSVACTWPRILRIRLSSFFFSWTGWLMGEPSIPWGGMAYFSIKGIYLVQRCVYFMRRLPDDAPPSGLPSHAKPKLLCTRLRGHAPGRGGACSGGYAAVRSRLRLVRAVDLHRTGDRWVSCPLCRC